MAKAAKAIRQLRQILNSKYTFFTVTQPNCPSSQLSLLADEPMSLPSHDSQTRTFATTALLGSPRPITPSQFLQPAGRAGPGQAFPKAHNWQWSTMQLRRFELRTLGIHDSASLPRSSRKAG